MLKGFSAVCFSLFTLLPASAQERQEVSNPAEQAYDFSIVLKVLDRNAAVTVMRRADVVTISGKPIAIKLDGRTIQGMAVFTVYAGKNKQTVCLAQTQLLVKEDERKEGQWVSILQSIPFVLGDAFEFYPLGKDNYNANNLLFELKIERHDDFSQNMTPVPKRTPEYSR